MNNDRVVFSQGVIHKEELYFFENLIGIPGKVNLQTGEVVYIDDLSGYKIQNIEPVDYMIYIDGVIYALERSGEHLMVINIDKRKCSYIRIDCNDKECDNFAYLTHHNGNLYIVPRYRKEILKFEIVTEKVSYFRYHISENVACGIKDSTNIYIFPQSGYEIVLFDINKNKFENFDIRKKIENIISCSMDEKFIYLLNTFGKIYKWNILRKKIEIDFKIETEDISFEKFGRIICVNEKLIILPLLGEQIYIISLKDYKKIIYSSFPEKFEYVESTWGKYHGCCEDEKFIYYAPRTSNYMLIIDKKSAKLSWLFIKIKDIKQRRQTWVKYMQNSIEYSFMEKILPVDYILDKIISENIIKEYTESYYGKNIWNSVK